MNQAHTRLAELRNLCTTASNDDLLELVENNTTVEAALQHWIGVQAARLQNRDGELAVIRTQNRRDLAELMSRLAAESHERDTELAALERRYKVVAEELGEYPACDLKCQSRAPVKIGNGLTGVRAGPFLHRHAAQHRRRVPTA